MEANAKRPADTVLDVQITESLKRHHRTPRSLFVSALTAGLEIGFSLLAMAVLYTHFVGTLSTEMLFLLITLGYPIGFILVVIGDSDLFTEHTTLATYPVLSGNESLARLMRTWLIILAGNLLGGYIFSTLLLVLIPHLGTVDTASVVAIAEKVLDIDYQPMFLSAIVAGWLMGLVSWLAASTKETLSTIFIIVMITGLIGITGLHHSIVGSVEVFSGYLASPTITLLEYVRFLVVAVVGNAIGGVLFVAILKYSQSQRPDSASD